MGKIVTKRANGDYLQWSGVSLEVMAACQQAHVVRVLGDAIDDIRVLTEQLAQERKRLVRLLSALKGIQSIVEIHSEATDNNFAWAELVEVNAAIAEAEAELKQEPVATVYIGSGHCKVAFADAAKEAMKGRQGQSFDVYSYPMPRAAKESLTVESVAAQVPQEWRDFVASVAENKLLQPDCVCERCEWTRRAIALLKEVKP